MLASASLVATSLHSLALVATLSSSLPATAAHGWPITAEAFWAIGLHSKHGLLTPSVRALRMGCPAATARRRASDRSVVEQGHGIHRAGTRRARPARVASSARVYAGGAGGAQPGVVAPENRSAGEIHLPHESSESKRDSLLPPDPRTRGGDGSTDLHSDRRPGLHGVRCDLPALARAVYIAEGAWAHRGGSPPLAARGSSPDRRHRWRTH